MLFSGDLCVLDSYLCEAAPLGLRMSKYIEPFKRTKQTEKRRQDLTLGPLCFVSSVRQKLRFAINPRHIVLKVAFEMAFIIYLE